MDWYESTKNIGYISLLTCNHDTIRPSYNLNDKELRLFYSFVFTMPGVPFLYYGDEIGMRFLDLPTKEGGYFRTGSRTPMQWNRGTNLGFSHADSDQLYLPVDSASDAPTVSDQEADPDSLLSFVKKLIRLRHTYKELQADGDFKVICSEPGRPFVYRRSRLTIAVNTSSKPLNLHISLPDCQLLFAEGNGAYDAAAKLLTLNPQSFLIFG